jgi:hypothetical protein
MNFYLGPGREYFIFIFSYFSSQDGRPYTVHPLRSTTQFVSKYLLSLFIKFPAFMKNLILTLLINLKKKPALQHDDGYVRI